MEKQATEVCMGCWSREDIRKIIGIGLPSFIVEGSLAIMVVLYNITFSSYFGTDGVTAYAMVNYLHVVLLMLFTRNVYSSNSWNEFLLNRSIRLHRWRI